MKELTDMIQGLENNDGITLKNYKAVRYKSGWQVADHGTECRTAEEAVKAVCTMGGNCGIWLENGIYYVDHSFRVNTKKQAIAIGREHQQISVYGWKLSNLAYC